MIHNYIKIAWRSLKKDSLFSSINIFGLAIGLAITMLLFLFVIHEQSFDEMYPKKDQIYRVLLNTDDSFKHEIWANVPSALGPTLVQEIPEIEASVRFLKYGFGKKATVGVDRKRFIEPHLYWADAEVLSMFDIALIHGNAVTALNKPNTVVVSESTAKRYFGVTNPIGKQLHIDNNIQLEVTGVYKDFPKNSTLDCNVIGSFSTQYFYSNPTWDNASFETFILNAKEASVAIVEEKIQQVLNKNIDKAEQWYTFSIQPLSAIHLHSATYKDSYTSRKGDIKEVQILAGLALLILIIACINYMNLITARAQKRAIDVGINKTLGATTKGLMLRFFIETGLITAIAMIIGIFLVFLILPLFATVVNKSIIVSDLFSLQLLVMLIVVWGVTTVFAGVYPAVVLSKFSPKEALKPSNTQGVSAGLTRKGLVVLQFCASVVLIIGVLVMYKQLQFMKQKDLGFNPEQVLAISVSSVKSATKATLVNQLKALPEVRAVALAQGFPTVAVSTRTLLKNDADKQGLNIQTNFSDPDLINVLQLKLLEGQLLPKTKLETDSLVEVVLNKKAVDYLGLTPQKAIGKRVNMQLGTNVFIRGVVDNFNYESLHQPIGGYAFHNRSMEMKSYVLLRFSSNALSKSLSTFETVFKTLDPTSIFEYNFLDKNTERLYAKDEQMATVGLAFSILAILVACLGLFGLAAFTAERRTKEIGIRKVLGASIVGITRLLTVEFIRLVLIAFVIGFPIAYWLMTQWLQNFAYRTRIGVFEFVVSGVLSLFIALFTVSFQSVKAARTNPIQSLKTQ